MGNNDWYRKKSWTTQDREMFFSRLERSRTLYNKSQYLRIQAYTLQVEANPPLYEAALELLDQLVREAPDENQLATASLQKAKCLEGLGRIQEALAAYRESVRNGLDKSGVQTTDAPFQFGAFVIKNRLKSYYNEVLQSFKGSGILLLLPGSQYLYHSILAVAGREDGRRSEARNHARKALEIGRQSGLSDPVIDGMLGECLGS